MSVDGREVPGGIRQKGAKNKKSSLTFFFSSSSSFYDGKVDGIYFPYLGLLFSTYHLIFYSLIVACTAGRRRFKWKNKRDLRADGDRIVSIYASIRSNING